MRFISAIYVPKEKLEDATMLINSLLVRDDNTLERFHLPGRWHHEEWFSVYTVCTWWNPLKKLNGYLVLSADRELKILRFRNFSASFDFQGFKTVTERSGLSLLAHSVLWAGVSTYFRSNQFLFHVQCFIPGEQPDIIAVDTLLGEVETVRMPQGSLYLFCVTDLLSLNPLARSGCKCFVNIGDAEYTYDNNGLCLLDKEILNDQEKYLP
jgi:hypothetical protein